MRTSLSIIIITLNESRFITTCLESVAWADEIVIVDSGSTDETIEICKAYTDRILVTDWPGPGAQRNRALEMATSDWVLALDADEWVSPELQDEIKTVISNPRGNVAFEMPRLSNYCGRFMQHSGWWPDRITRLFQRSKAHFNAELIHDHMIVDGKIGRLSNHLMHIAFEDIEDVLGKMNRYSTDGARVMFQHGRKSSLCKALLHSLWAFIHTYIIRAGFLDGREGFMLAISNVEVSYYKYLKLLLLNKK